jgi:hypothetical protein
MVEKAVTAESMERYRRSAGKAQVADLLGKITGASTDLVRYDAVASRLRARQQIEMGTRMVPLEQIVGSVGRYRDFTRTFLPRAGISPDRWARIDAIMHSLEGYLPIELYKIGQVYFVRDGNHRVSVARANGLTHIEAYVTELETDVDLTLDDFARDQWIIKIERAEFLKSTEAAIAFSCATSVSINMFWAWTWNAPAVKRSWNGPRRSRVGMTTSICPWSGQFTSTSCWPTFQTAPKRTFTCGSPFTVKN